MSSGIEGAMSRSEFDSIFGDLFSKIPDWQLKAAAEHVQDIVDNRLGFRIKKGKKKHGCKSRKRSRDRSQRLGIQSLKGVQLSRRIASEEYRKYLKSDEWAVIRSKIMIRDHGQCRACCGKATQVHHRSYSKDAMSGKNLELLVAICNKCHHEIHFDGLRKCSMLEVESQLYGIFAANTALETSR